MIYGYIRVSTTKQEKQYSSLQEQYNIVSKYNPDHVFRDIHTSSTLGRPNLSILLTKLRRYDTIIVKDVSRLTRVKEHLDYLLSLFLYNDIKLIIDTIHYLPYSDEWYTMLNLDIQTAENKLHSIKYISSKGGKPRIPIDVWLEVIRSSNLTLDKISSNLNISRSSVADIKRITKEISIQNSNNLDIDQMYYVIKDKHNNHIPIEYLIAIVNYYNSI